jgi:signal transduction histidine kinase
VALAVLAIGTLAMIRLPKPAAAVQGPLLAAVVLAATALTHLQPDGLGFLGVFPAISVAALHLAERQAALVAGLAVAALSIAGAVGGRHHAAVGVVLHDFAVIAFLLLAVVARRYRDANDRARRLIVELSETRKAQAEAAALGERQRLAREIHDVLAHSLSGLAINLETARLISEHTGADPQVAEAIGRGQRLAKAGLAEARRAIGMLRGDALPGPERLAQLATDFEGDTGIPCTFDLDGAPRDLRSDGRLTVYRVAQEALTNIRKHADPERVQIRLAYRPAGTELTIEDHQSDRRPPRGDGTGYGLTGMRERAELLGGTLTAVPTTGGFRVALWIPS